MLCGTLVVLTACGFASRAYTEAPTTCQCEAAADDRYGLEACARAGGEVLELLASAIAPAVGRVTGRRARVVARCETGWNRELDGSVRAASAVEELKECRACPWADPIEYTR